MDKNFAFIGFGLIGGSLAKSIRKHIPDAKIYAYMRSRNKLEAARQDKVVDFILEGIDENLKQADIIFLCTPVEYSEEYLKSIKPFIRKDCIITDVGSTKTSIHKSVIDLALEENFIGGHPMAGSEKTGYEASTELLLENAYYMLTPTAKTSKDMLHRLETLVSTVRSIPFIVDYQQHDKIVAAISHLPHLIAASLVNLVKDSDGDDQMMKRVAAGGFKDITRIASSSPVIWEQICKTNRLPIIDILDSYIKALEKIKEDLILDTPSAIHDLFESSKAYRNSLSDESIGLISSKNLFSVHIVDKPGVISIISAILAAHSISIKNIGINHNRESGEGVLRIAFYDSDSCELAAKLLREYNYTLDF